VRARAVHFTAPRRVELREVDVPEPGVNRVLVGTECSGISSGTELLAYRGEVDPELALDESLGSLAGTFAYPFRYGYSAVGRVLRGGGDLREGQLVFAFHPHQDRFVVGADQVTPVDGLDPAVATMYPLVETALQVCLDAAPRLGETAVVTGLGAVGVLVAALLARTGAEVLGSEPLPARRGGWIPRSRSGPAAVAPTCWWRPAATPTRSARRCGCWPTRAWRWSAPGTAPGRHPCRWGRTSTAGG
jgi:2-desacetyl-2-hydroxyethyl bacteriochlorophyllide A dehydrogenase